MSQDRDELKAEISGHILKVYPKFQVALQRFAQLHAVVTALRRSRSDALSYMAYQPSEDFEQTMDAIKCIYELFTGHPDWGEQVEMIARSHAGELQFRYQELLDEEIDAAMDDATE